MSYLELAQAYAKACRERDMALSQLADIGAGYAEKMDDFVRVVRCKDCKNIRLVGRPPFMVYVCAHNKGLGDIVRHNDFCSYGEREENG